MKRNREKNEANFLIQVTNNDTIKSGTTDIKAVYIESNKSTSNSVCDSDFWTKYSKDKRAHLIYVCAVSSRSTFEVTVTQCEFAVQFIVHRLLCGWGMGIHVHVLCAPLMHHYFAIVKTKDNTVFVRISIKTYGDFFCCSSRLIYVRSLPSISNVVSKQVHKRQQEFYKDKFKLCQPLNPFEPATAHQLVQCTAYK